MPLPQRLLTSYLPSQLAGSKKQLNPVKFSTVPAQRNKIQDDVPLVPPVEAVSGVWPLSYANSDLELLREPQVRAGRQVRIKPDQLGLPTLESTACPPRQVCHYPSLAPHTPW